MEEKQDNSEPLTTTPYSINAPSDRSDSVAILLDDGEETHEGDERYRIDHPSDEDHLRDVYKQYKANHADDSYLQKMFRIKPVSMYFAEAAASGEKY